MISSLLTPAMIRAGGPLASFALGGQVASVKTGFIKRFLNTLPVLYKRRFAIRSTKCVRDTVR